MKPSPPGTRFSSALALARAGKSALLHAIQAAVR